MTMTLPDPDAVIGLGGEGTRQRRGWYPATIDAWIEEQTPERRPCRQYLSASDMMRMIGEPPSYAPTYRLPPADAVTRETDGWTRETVDTWIAQGPRPTKTKGRRQVPAAVSPAGREAWDAAVANRRRKDRLTDLDEAARAAGYRDLAALIETAQSGGHGQQWIADQLHIPRPTLRYRLQAAEIEVPAARPQVAEARLAELRAHLDAGGSIATAPAEVRRWLTVRRWSRKKHGGGPIEDQLDTIAPGWDGSRKGGAR